MIIQIAKQKDKTWNAYVLDRDGKILANKEGFEKMAKAQEWAEIERDYLEKQ